MVHFLASAPKWCTKSWHDSCVRTKTVHIYRHHAPHSCSAPPPCTKMVHSYALAHHFGALTIFWRTKMVRCTKMVHKKLARFLRAHQNSAVPPFRAPFWCKTHLARFLHTPQNSAPAPKYSTCTKVVQEKTTVPRGTLKITGTRTKTVQQYKK